MACANTDIFEVVKSSMLSNDHANLKKHFSDIKKRLDDRVYLSEEALISTVGKSVTRDYSVECYFPSTIKPKRLLALSSLPTGDCLYSSVSLALFGDNTACDDLRVLTCIELFLNSKFYSEHPTITSVYEKNKTQFSNYMSVFSCCVSDTAFNSTLAFFF